MSPKHDMSHNACYDYSRCRWNLQPGDMLKFHYRDSDIFGVGEVLLVSFELVHVRRLKDGRIFVISTSDMRDWHLSRVNNVIRLPNGVFKVGDRVRLDGDLNLSGEKYIIEKFDYGRVKVHYFLNGRSVGWYLVREGEILKYMEVK